MTVRVVPSFKLRKTSWSMPLDELLDNHDALYNEVIRSSTKKVVTPNY